MNEIIKTQIKPQTDVHANVYTIGVVADMLGVSVPTIRKYEAEHLILPYRTESNHRRYSPTDVEILRCVREMIDDYGVSLKGINRLLALIPCWKMKDCSTEDREQCDAYYNDDVPCWSAKVKQGTCVEDDCRQCHVYDKASYLAEMKEVLKRY